MVHKITINTKKSSVTVKNTLMPCFFFETLIANKYWYGDWYRDDNGYVYYSSQRFSGKRLLKLLEELEKKKQREEK